MDTCEFLCMKNLCLLFSEYL